VVSLAQFRDVALDLIKSAKADGGYPDSDDDSDDSGTQFLNRFLVKCG
jgi:hypothetical protein